jgi:2-desacetyl-2-hydroxyethyl bacteriochlorophyllide A dehydrogenase
MVGRLRQGGRLEIDEDELPEPGDDDIVVKVSSCGICGTDLAFVRSGSAPDGAILGHEFSGKVTEVGRNVRDVAIGDHVTVNPMVDFVGLGRIPGAFAQYVRIPSPVAGRNIFTLPDTIGDEVGALVEPFSVGLHAVNRSGARAGDKVAIFGAGPIGICVLVALRSRGVESVLVIEPSEMRRRLAKNFGAAAVHNPRSGSTNAFVASQFGAKTFPYLESPVAQADILFDCAGVQPVLDESVMMLRNGGRLVLVADPHDLRLPVRFVMQHELTVIGAVGYENEFTEAIDLLGKKAVDLTPLVTHRFPLTQLAAAFQMQADADQAMKVLVQAEA